MQKKINPALLIMSILALVNVLFVPIFDVWGGLFPSSPDYNFFDVIEKLVKDADNWNMWVVQISVLIAIPSIFMLIFSLTNSRKLCAASAGIGIVLWLKNIIQFIDENEMSEVFDFDDCSISIGTWIAFFLFVAVLIVSLCIGHKKPVQQTPLTSTYAAGGMVEQNNTPAISVKFCPKCGTAIESGRKFCGKCGNNVYGDNISNNPEQ